MKKPTHLSLLLILILACLTGVYSNAWCETLKFPLKIDYPKLQALMRASLFTDEGSAIRLTDPTDSCRHITLSNPRLSWSNNQLQLEMAVNMQGGTKVGGNCLFPVKWSGYIKTHPRPYINRTDWQLLFDWQDTEILDKNRNSALVMNRLWEVFEGPVLKRLNSLSINLNPPVAELPAFLLEMTSPGYRTRVKKLINSLKPGEIRVSPKELSLYILGDMDIPDSPGEKEAPKPLSQEELEAFVGIWETWDTFLVNTLLSLSGEPLTSQERQVLLDVLLSTRYKFVAELSTDKHRPNDFVREQFVWAWERLAPILRNHLSNNQELDPWAYLAFFTASDALTVMDKLGPGIGVDISRDGLIRLARMLSQDKNLILHYKPTVVPRLKQILGLGPPLEISKPGPGKEQLNLNRKPTDFDKQRTLISTFKNILTPRQCWASTSAGLPGIKELRRWLPPKKTIEPYLQKVKAVINEAARKNLQNSAIPQQYHDILHQVALATAWQETCFRQFIVDDGKLAFIRSYDNTSVGLMQINERVWRGLYDIQYLRWSIRYNAEAGVEILKNYFTKYALPKSQTVDSLGTDGLAACIYAMYNGGPSQFKGFLKRHETGQFYKTDRLFKEKYTWVKNNQWERLSDCLIGK